MSASSSALAPAIRTGSGTGERTGRHVAGCHCGGKHAGGGGIAAKDPAVPIVFLQVANPIGSGLVASLAHPGANLTGFTNFEPAIGGKWLELLKEVAPGVTRAIAIFNPETHSGQYWQSIEAAASSLAVKSIEPRLAMLPGSRTRWQVWRVDIMAAYW